MKRLGVFQLSPDQMLVIYYTWVKRGMCYVSEVSCTRTGHNKPGIAIGSNAGKLDPESSARACRTLHFSQSWNFALTTHPTHSTVVGHWRVSQRILRDPGATSQDMRYFRASDIFDTKVYFKSCSAPGNFFLPNEFQKWSKSVSLIGQKNIFLANQRGGLAG